MINWGKLKFQNRVKDVGIPWNEEETKAIYELKIPADYVRKGVLTLKDYEKMKNEPIMSKEEVMAEAEKLGIKFDPDVDKEILEKEIEFKKKLETKEESKKESKPIGKKRKK